MPLQLPTSVIVGAVIVAAFFVFFIGLALLFKRMFQKAGADEALVRTGMGGTKVVIGGGLFVFPIVHQLMRVSLRTITLTVERSGRLALVTADKIKACCTMELYMKVDDTEEAVIAAARSFGSRNVDEGVLAEIVEGKLTDALRGVSANKTFHELHAQREEFAEAVKKALVDELRKNGLKLESTSLTQLSQLPITEMDPNDVFDAEGLRNINMTVASNLQQTNEIERTKEVTIEHQDVVARKRALELEQEKAFLEAEQSKKIAEYRAKQKAQERMAVLEQEQAAAEAALAQKREVENAKIAQEEAVATRDLQRQEAVARAEAAKLQAERTAQILAAKEIEAAQVVKSETIEAAEIRKAKAIEAAEVDKKRAIEVAEIEKAVALANAETEKSKAEALKANAEADEAAAIEAITTAEQTAKARREKEIAVIKAEEESDRSKIKADEDAYKNERAAHAEREVTKAKAEAEAAQAAGRAQAVRERAQAEADELRLAAQATKEAAELEAAGEAEKKRIAAQASADEVRYTAEAQADKIRVEAVARAEACDKEAVAKIRLAEATLEEGKAQAEARRLMVQAENAIDSRLLMLKAAEQAIAVSPEVVREFVKSAEVIGDMKVLQIGGGGFGGGSGEEGGFMGEMGKTPLGLGLTTLAQGTALLPLIKGLMEHAGVGTDDVLNKVKSAVAAGAAELNSENGRSKKPRNGHGPGSNGSAKKKAQSSVAVVLEDEDLPPSLKR